MEDKTTIEIYKKDLPTIKRWRRKTKLSNVKLFNRLINSAANKILFDEYCKRELTPRDDFKRPLSGRKIIK
jgi:hypothetical protein